MSITRRRILMGATALTAVALTRRFAAYPKVVPLTAPNEAVAVTGNVLVLHDGGPAGLAFARKVHGTTRSGEVTGQAVALLTLSGFKRAGALLDSSRGRTLIALLNDAETLVIEDLLKVRSAAELDRRRYGRQVLLTARL